ncbi:UDP-Glycosyltransferase/glycogen phosphorylase [Cristinia sonorae]|uniref:UDP-Glycosyltransferase/glycogen phosphorylase n=1 Tax=Cristinia sonorae TaxID=1940300 RepID=A0A8K0UH74_9AGAR|nr:UDP-Glycosyltransferase/glycogen phosphorylase [Cristinia sonorae]
METHTHLPHLVIAGVEAWGHARPLCAFASHVVATRNVHVTLFTFPKVLDRVVTEIARGFGPKDSERQKLIRVIALDTSVEPSESFGETMAREQRRYLEVFALAYRQLFEEKPVTCATTGTEYPAIPSPKTVVFDFMVGPLVRVVKGIDDKAKMVLFCSAMASFAYLSFAPVERGGQGDFRQCALKIAEETGKEVVDVADELLSTYTNKIYQLPSFPKMYHWEFDPQDTNFLTKGIMGPIWFAVHDCIEHCDGMLITSPEAYEPAAIIAIKEWFAETNRGVWAIGPLLPPMSSAKAMTGEQSLSGSSDVIKNFMDKTLVTHGQHSMIYISFGSIFWPAKFEKVEAFIDVVLEMKIPFIFSHASPLAQLPETFQEKVNQSSVGLLSPWSPQQTILSHPVLGWFVTHGGHNSTLEAVSSGVPMICWPFHADQPINAVNLTENHQVAYELLEIRTGNGLKPIYRTGKAPLDTIDGLKDEVRGVLKRAFGKDGEEKRTNMWKLKVVIDGAWKNGGSSEANMANFLGTL